jgi:hypothetical protein
MKKRSLSLGIVLIMSWILVARAGADAVYLKNGRVMTGRIVERTQDRIILRTGEGATEVRSTIFIDDILRIQGQEEYAKESGQAIQQLIKTEFLKKAAPQEPFYRRLSLPTDSGAADIRKMILEDRRAQANPIKEEVVSVGTVAEQPPAGTPSLSAPQGRASAESAGSIAGFVRLPAPVFQECKGNLLIFLMERQMKNDQEVFVAGLKVPYELIPAENILTPQVRYKLERISAGTYRVFAEWDVAPGAVEPIETENQVAFIGLWGKGDYAGSSSNVVLETDGYRDDVNFDCKTLIENDNSVGALQQLMDFKISDLYYRSTPGEDPRFFVRIKNNHTSSLVPIAFDVYVNDEKVWQEPMSFGPLQAQEEKEFDITSAYEEHKKIVEGREGAGALTSKSIKFRLVWTLDKDVSFEKTVFLF